MWIFFLFLLPFLGSGQAQVTSDNLIFSFNNLTLQHFWPLIQVLFCNNPFVIPKPTISPQETELCSTAPLIH